MSMSDAFEFRTEELTITLGGVKLDLWGVFTATCDAGNDGKINEIKWASGHLHCAHPAGSVERAMFEALAAEFYSRCADEIAEGLAEGPVRRREAYYEHQIEQAMGK